MNFRTIKERTQVDVILLFITLCLVAFGVVMVYSSSAVLASASKASKYSSSFYLVKQLVNLIVGLAAMMVCMRIPYPWWEKRAKLGLAISIFFLGILLVMKALGVGGMRGSYRWLPLGPFSFQPSELAKLGTIVYIAASLARRQDRITDLVSGYLPHLIILGTVLAMIALEPNLGMTLAIFATVSIMLYAGRVRPAHIAATALAFLPVLYFIIFVIGYRKERILAYLSPSEHTQGMSYHVTQSLVAIGSGGIFGVGLGESRQKLFFLPEPHTDFVFSIIGEELGFVGAMIVIALFFAWVGRGLRIARNAPDLHSFFLAIGLTMMIAVYAVLNICVTVALIPTAGLPLPFISYGGSSLIFALAGTGILLNISKYARPYSLWSREVELQVRPSRVRAVVKKILPTGLILALISRGRQGREKRFTSHTRR